jgi:Fe-S cluster assembly iron-binding protein IscA
MFTVTEAALDRLSWKLAHKKAANEMAMRFAEKEGGWRLRLDHQGPNDTVFAHRGRNVLLLDRAVAQAMTNRTLDTRNTAAGSRLTLR